MGGTHKSLRMEAEPELGARTWGHSLQSCFALDLNPFTQSQAWGLAKGPPRGTEPVPGMQKGEDKVPVTSHPTSKREQSEKAKKMGVSSCSPFHRKKVNESRRTHQGSL